VEDHTFFHVTGTLKSLEYPLDQAMYGPRSSTFRAPWKQDQKRVILRRMAEEIRAGRSVIMLASSRELASRPYLLSSLHWTYVSKLNLTETEVENLNIIAGEESLK
jgi:hypothetical protein